MWRTWIDNFIRRRSHHPAGPLTKRPSTRRCFPPSRRPPFSPATSPALSASARVTDPTRWFGKGMGILGVEQWMWDTNLNFWPRGHGSQLLRRFVIRFAINEYITKQKYGHFEYEFVGIGARSNDLKVVWERDIGSTWNWLGKFGLKLTTWSNCVRCCPHRNHITDFNVLFTSSAASTICKCEARPVIIVRLTLELLSSPLNPVTTLSGDYSEILCFGPRTVNMSPSTVWLCKHTIMKL